MTGPLERFCDELEALIDDWTDKPADDRLTIAEVVGVLECVKVMIISDMSGASE